MRKFFSVLFIFCFICKTYSSELSFVTSNKEIKDTVNVEIGAILKINTFMHISYRQGKPNIYAAVYLDNNEISKLECTKFGADLSNVSEYEIMTSGKHIITLESHFSNDYNNKSGGYMSVSYNIIQPTNIRECKNLYKNEHRKIIKNGKIMIIQGENVFNILGQQIKNNIGCADN